MKKVVVLILMFSFLFVSSSYAKTVKVKGSYTKKGTYKQSHYRTSSNKSKADNWSTKGNTNPYTGKKGTK